MSTVGEPSQPALDSESKRIVYVGGTGLPVDRRSARRGLLEDPTQIHIINFDGTGDQQLTHSALFQPNTGP